MEKISCLKCYKEEDAGHNSKRMWETAYWDKRVDIDKLMEDTQEDGSVLPKYVILICVLVQSVI